MPRPDVVDKSSGKPIYAMDVQVPGMVYATLARAPVRGSGPTTFNRDELGNSPASSMRSRSTTASASSAKPSRRCSRRACKLKAEWKDAPGSKVDSTANLHEYLAHVRDPARKGVVGRTHW